MCDSTIYEDVLNEFNSDKIIKLRSIINELLNLEEGRSESEKNTNNDIRCIALNITKETNVQSECMRKILDLTCYTYRNRIFSPDLNEEFVKKYKKICEDYQLGGRVIDKSDIKYFGHAVDKENFKNRVANANHKKVASNYDSPEALLEDLKIMSVDEILNLSDFRNFDLHFPKRIMWATWSQSLNAEDPFDFMRTRNLRADPPKLGSSCEVGLSLGLCCKALTTGTPSNMLLLTYKVGEIDAHIPTIADAWGNKYFSPCPNGASHGWTDTDHPDLKHYYIRRCLIPSGESDYNDQARPEAVHKPIKINCLTRIHELPTSISSNELRP